MAALSFVRSRAHGRQEAHAPACRARVAYLCNKIGAGGVLNSEGHWQQFGKTVMFQK
jgi:hypothetical protein